MQNILLETMYILSGLVGIAAAFHALRDKNHPHPKETAAFWGIFGGIFIFGKYLPGYINGILIIVIGVLAALNRVVEGSMKTADEDKREASAIKIGNNLFIPALTIGVVAFIVGQYIPSLGALVGLGLGSLIATGLAMVMTKTEVQNISFEGSRLLLSVGTAAILPQLLTALGALFNAAGVGQVIATGIGGVIPEGNLLAGIIAYCLGMAIFTMIMGNAFAAFAVITAGIGMPFVYAYGANPTAIGILALTAGYCGTLMTPMAANFNVVPAALLETTNKNRVIIAQAPFALVLLLTHIVLMYMWAI
ncbi:MAG: DUF979 domain-containing protein [Tissierellales bacterium]|nr:DUF979 domain-containing protein [Tissierellales bacterium]MBN2826573.1 DUF979 domain-containing protein [Tissierellales bacterium]